MNISDKKRHSGKKSVANTVSDFTESAKKVMLAVSRPTLVSLFSGAGGLDAGLEQAGFHTVVAVDNDPDCISTLRSNQATRIVAEGGRHFLQDTKLINASLENVEPAQLRPQGADRNWAPDLMAGGPPCQPFSSSGKQYSLDDPRGRLFEHFVRLAAGLQPRLILFENVRGLVTAKGPGGEPGEVLLLVKKAFERIGYATTFALLNAADFCVPQRRVRCFMMASRCALLPQFPEASHEEQPAPSLFGSKLPWVSLGDFLASQPPPEEYDIVRPTPALAAQLALVPDGSGLKSPGARETTRPGGHWGYKQGTFIADLTQPARTITAASTQDWIRLKDGTLRRLTWRECAGIQGFPAAWRFDGSSASRFRQIGNAVPVMFGRLLGQCLLEALAASKGRTIKPTSAPLPSEFLAAITYTKRENQRNGASRKAAIQRQTQQTYHLKAIKGLGSDDGKWRSD